MISSILYLRMVTHMKTVLLVFLVLFTSPNLFAFDHSHGKFNQILDKHLKVIGHQSLVNYKNLKASPAVLDNYLKTLSAVTKQEYKSFSSNEQLAFLINAYNAFTLKLIINHYPIKSIKKIGGFFSKPWGIEFFTLFGEKYTLDKVEHKTIRKNFKEAKIHFAVNCASIGCPSLYKEAFVAEKLEQQLLAASKNFLQNKTKNKINLKKNSLVISKIFDWYEGDFDKHESSVKHFIAKILKLNSADTNLILSNKVDIDYTDYDWLLNEWKD
jgi:hypothetical protein